LFNLSLSTILHRFIFLTNSGVEFEWSQEGMKSPAMLPIRTPLPSPRDPGAPLAANWSFVATASCSCWMVQSSPASTESAGRAAAAVLGGGDGVACPPQWVGNLLLTVRSPPQSRDGGGGRVCRIADHDAGQQGVPWGWKFSSMFFFFKLPPPRVVGLRARFSQTGRGATFKGGPSSGKRQGGGAGPEVSKKNRLGRRTPDCCGPLALHWGPRPHRGRGCGAGGQLPAPTSPPPAAVPGR